jgi:hypothetical protein
MTNTGINRNARMPRKSLSSQIDRLDGILDGLDAALSGAVADAVQAVVGQVVKEAVEASIKEVLGSPELLRAALAQHAAPVPEYKPRRSLREVLKAALGGLGRKGCEAATQAKRKAGQAWSWCLNKLAQGISHAYHSLERLRARGRRAWAVAVGVVRLAWRLRRACVVALGVGALSAVGVYYAGPVVASVLCGIGSSLATAAGIALAPVWRLLLGSEHGV